ncbi:MAG: NAD(P)/FAD-dependent oxidoreductase [Thermoplasmata archaeon]|nr:NAD(P)/FAD-dependent oxidoreductase [Thermoplasmata archaeon]
MPGFPRLLPSYDMIVVGGGHAGLQAGLKAARLNHTACILDRGPKYSRSYYAPTMDNIPGFPDGISGHKLLDLQIAQVRSVEEKVGYFTPARATTAAAEPAGGYRVEFEWLGQRRSVLGRTLLLAMGVVDRIPIVGGSIETIFPWANFGIVDFCIFCDGHTFRGKTTAVIGSGRYAVETALDLRHFEPASIELLTHGAPLLADEPEPERATLRGKLEAAGIPVHDPEIVGFDGIREKRLGIRFADGSVRTYDKGFSALPWYDLHGEIPASLGASFDRDGYVVTDEDGRVLDAGGRAIPGFYCAGDQRNGWNQIPEAWATAERAVIHAYSYYL